MRLREALRCLGLGFLLSGSWPEGCSENLYLPVSFNIIVCMYIYIFMYLFVWDILSTDTDIAPYVTSCGDTG